MFGSTAKTEVNTKPLAKAVDDATFRNLGHAAATIRKDAAASIEKVDGPSPEGQPIHTHRGAYARRALRYAVETDFAVIGPRASMVGEAFAAHEFGEVFRGTDYPERPTMGPALERNLDRFASSWAGSVG